MSNKLYFGDNLDVLRNYVKDETVDLVYLDPPFNSQIQYNVLFQTPEESKASAQAGAFRDTWSWGEEAERSYADMMRYGGPAARLLDALRNALGEIDLMAYLTMMSGRLVELRRIIKPTGSLYLHCDPSASHYLKLMLDAIFGHNQFLNEIIWKRTSAHSSAKRFGPIHDTILYYGAGGDYVWNRNFLPYSEDYISNFYTHQDANGRKWRRSDLTGAGTRRGETGQAWRGINVTAKGRHWAWPPAELEKMDANGRIHWPAKEDGMPMLKRYLEDQPGVAYQDIIDDIKPMHNLSKERTHYPTQKPLELLKRFLLSSSNEGDVVLDPFCGCGTTIEAAESLKREWIGIDVAIHAIKVIEGRLKNKNFTLEGMPKDFASAIRLAENDKYQFQWWANYLFNPHALREQKKGADRGVDGELFFPNGPGQPWGKMLTSVKGGDHVGPSMVRDFGFVLDRDKADLGLFICLRKPTPAMVKEAASCGFPKTGAHTHIPRLQIVAIEDWFDGKQPKLPPLEHLPSAVFASRPPSKVKRPDLLQPELPLSFVGGRKDETVVRYLNPQMVSGAA